MADPCGVGTYICLFEYITRSTYKKINLSETRDFLFFTVHYLGYISRIDLSAKMDSLKHEQKELEQGKKSTDIIMNQEQDDKSKDKKKERE